MKVRIIATCHQISSLLSSRSQRKVFVEYIFPDLLDCVFTKVSRMAPQQLQVRQENLTADGDKMKLGSLIVFPLPTRMDFVRVTDKRAKSLVVGGVRTSKGPNVFASG